MPRGYGTLTICKTDYSRSVPALHIDIWSDIACPWCWVGKRHFESARARFGHEVELRWHAFELDPSAPKAVDGSIDYVDRLAKKYRTSRDGAQQMIDRMNGVGTSAGLDFRFDRAKAGNTFDAHRLLHWAAGKGKQDALKERLFQAYMHEGRSVADPDTLVELAAEVGLDAERAQSILATDEFAAEVRTDEARAAELGVTGVPFFVVGGRYAIGGAQPADVLLQAMTRAWEEGLAGSVIPFETDDEAEACGPDGCAVPSPS